MRAKLIACTVILLSLLVGVAAWASETYEPPPDSKKPVRVTAQGIYAQKCSKCHSISRSDGAVKPPDEWKAIVPRMRAKDLSWISEEEAGKIASFLSGRALFKVKCTKCHNPERADVQKTAVQWQSTVLRMQGKLADWISDDDKKQILFYLTDVELLELE